MTDPRSVAGSPRPIATLRNGTEVAAWLFKAKPEVWDVIGAIEATLADPGRPVITSWEMAESYRVDLVAPGHPCVLWVTGGRHASTTGVWGLGRVTTVPRPAAPVGGRPRYEVGLDLEFAGRPVRLRDLLGDERFVRAEIVRAPRVSSPVALTASEVDAIVDLWPVSPALRQGSPFPPAGSGS